MTTAPEPMSHEDAVRTMAAERYLLDEMSEVERHAFEEHFFSCAECAEDMRIGDSMRTAAREMGQRSPAVLPFRRARRFQAVVPWAVAASLALMVGYQRLSMRGADQPYALEPVTLRTATRGADAIVRLRPADRAVALAIDAEAPAGAPEWLYELRAGDGRQVAAGRAAVQAPGSPLLLVMPASALASADRFTLSLRSREGASPVAEYQFAVVRVNTSKGAQ
jgi:hypothetical protein